MLYTTCNTRLLFIIHESLLICSETLIHETGFRLEIRIDLLPSACRKCIYTYVWQTSVTTHVCEQPNPAATMLYVCERQQADVIWLTATLTAVAWHGVCVCPASIVAFVWLAAIKRDSSPANNLN